MRSLSFRTVLATAVAAVTCLALTPTPYAADVTVRPFQRFVAKAPFDGDPGAPSRVDIVIERWSTDSECSDLGGALTARGPEGLLPGLHALRLRAGAVLIPEYRTRGHAPSRGAPSICSSLTKSRRRPAVS